MPRKRHAHNRFVQPESIVHLHQALRPGGDFLFKTDHPDYFLEACELIDASPLFQRLDWLASEEFYPLTDFESIWLAEGKSISQPDGTGLDKGRWKRRLFCEIFHHQHRTFGVADNLFGGAAQQHAFQSGVSMAGAYDHIHARTIGDITNRGPGITDFDDAFRGQTGSVLRGQVGQVFLEQLGQFRIVGDGGHGERLILHDERRSKRVQKDQRAGQLFSQGCCGFDPGEGVLAEIDRDEDALEFHGRGGVEVKLATGGVVAPQGFRKVAQHFLWTNGLHWASAGPRAWC